MKVRLIIEKIKKLQIRFNSRTREGATTICTQQVSSLRFNSRTREGATQAGGGPVPAGCFNSRTREGATVHRRRRCNAGWFQFTHP